MEKAFALIVEDNPLLANMFARALNDINYETLVIKDGRQAMNWLLQDEPDLLLLDMHLPYISGKEILEKFSDEPRFARTYIAIVTADARMGELMADKANFLFNKPIDLPQFQQFAQRLKGDKL